jgi:hypothetical protein
MSVILLVDGLPGIYAGTAGRGQVTTAFRIIRGKCAEEWPRDFNMRAYCETQQFDGFRALNASSIDEGARNACAQQWPNDYKMRRYCESKR